MDAVIAGIFALAGTALGAWFGRRGTEMAVRAAGQQAEEEHRRRREDTARELSAQGYALAVEAVTGLHSDRVEDSVIPGQLREEFEPRYLKDTSTLREARSVLLRLAATAADDEVAHAATNVVAQLAKLDDAWESARGWRSFMAKSEGEYKRFESHFDREMTRIREARRMLIGSDDERIHVEAEVGGVLSDDCLLARLRDASRK